MTALAMLRRLSLIGVVLVAAGTAGFIWLRLLWWLSVEDHGQPHLWLIRMMVILYVFTLAVVVPLMNDER